jgi:signal transduction histidine kinase
VLDNARKWARSQIAVSVSVVQPGGQVTIAVADDGPGVPAADRCNILRRGLRLDESKPGTGLGLAIVKEIVEAYGGEIELDQSNLGGLAIRIRLPAPAPMRTITAPA